MSAICNMQQRDLSTRFLDQNPNNCFISVAKTRIQEGIKKVQGVVHQIFLSGEKLVQTPLTAHHGIEIALAVREISLNENFVKRGTQTCLNSLRDTVRESDEFSICIGKYTLVKLNELIGFKAVSITIASIARIVTFVAFTIILFPDKIIYEITDTIFAKKIFEIVKKAVKVVTSPFWVIPVKDQEIHSLQDDIEFLRDDNQKTINYFQKKNERLYQQNRKLKEKLLQAQKMIDQNNGRNITIGTKVEKKPVSADRKCVIQ